MKELVILSGKGGTGKTSLTASFAALAGGCLLCDADVDAADLHLLMQPDVKQTTDFQGGGVAAIDPDRCTACGTCIDLCRWSAISEDFVVDEISCEGCGVCVDFCPEQAIDFPTKTCGQWFISDTRFGPMVHARLGIAEENSGKLVTLVRKEAKTLAEAKGIDLVITDGPPGVGCPVIASVGGATSVVIVAEPTVSGIHDMARAIELCQHFKVPVMVCINKYDLNLENSATIEKMARESDLPVVGRVPFDPAFTRAMVQGLTLVEFDAEGDAAAHLRQVWNTIMQVPAMTAA
ncbi:ATP-binding protein [Desulfosarcina ovata]|uniref:Cobyrinic acid a,c-diamide synthase n=2 Tax=Desulfosarcina ovata TaxID=83564 RepID=A0A5K8AI63_9BACT|nr:ATP-binding protein [Desulfosarcina ovata]BBO85274.1 cobyrinic acid a,c-diamide synthase [Desulfosarcina ovata subsp. sediminis]BBO92166.1 cobyrinic acid a,c-diamide synthase [Desulfosarcina ovata subsp. ovata]